jgi:cytochrome o ubiquinol oxidase subunit 2
MGLSPSLLDPAGPVGEAERTLLFNSLAIMLAIGVPTMVATLWVAFWFREGNTRARRLPRWSYSGRVELIVWSIPALVVLFLGGIAWVSSHRLDPAEPVSAQARASLLTPPPAASQALEIEVVALDWKWLFIYPEQNLASINRLVVPVHVPLRFRITSASVFNAFFIPQLGSQIYAMDGMRSPLNLEADRPGHYLGLSANFSGDGFADMHFDVDAVSAVEFADWLATVRAGGRTLDDGAYRALLVQSARVPSSSYGSVKAHLFDDIVAMREPEGESPRGGEPLTSIKPR